MRNDFLSKLLILGILILPCLNASAQTATSEAKKADLNVMVSAKPDDAKGAFALVPMMGVNIRLYLADGTSYEMISSDMDLTTFRNLPAGCEYVAEIFCKGYTTAIYHGKVSGRPGARAEFYTVRDSEKPAKKTRPFKDSGAADIEGFAVCPASWNWVSTPLYGATVSYTSSVDAVSTTTDRHGYFRFDGIKDKSGKISISHSACISAEFSVTDANGGRWLWLTMKPEP